MRTTTRRRPRTGRSRTLGAVLLLAGAALLGGCGRAHATAPAPSVAVARVARADLANTMTLQAEFLPFQDVMLHAKVSGYVNPILVDIGDRVKAGQLLARLEVPELKDQLEGAQAAQRRAGTEHAIAHLNSDRLIGVNKSQPNLVSQQDLDDAQAKDAAAEAALATARADADRYATLLDYTQVTAPFSGIITKRFVDNGSLVEAGTASATGPIVELAEDDLLRLRFPVPEAETPLIHRGGPVTIAVDALHRTFTAKVARDSGAIDRATRTMVVEVDVPNPDGAYKAGMYASVTIPVQVAPRALVVPLQALSAGDKPTVLVVTADDTLLERPVVVGMRTSALAEVRSGLAEGDQVVVGERSGLVPGLTVVPKAADLPADY